MKKTELLSPAGSIESVFQAVHNGADAVYLGGADFGARAYAANFSYEQMKQAIYFCHLYGVKVFVTVNTLIYQHETEDFLNHLRTIYELGADAFIIQDIGMMDAARQMFPDIELHASTQMHNHNDACLWFVKSLGAQRAVLAREMRLDEIKKFTCPIEKEVFVHGALCICYSGQCLFSALTLERSGNRGKCAQSCRMKYSLVDKSGKNIKTGYLLSPRDIALLEDANKLQSIGIDCLKIEGRMKPPEYVGLVTKIYRALLDGKKVSATDLEDLRKLFNRGFSKGHLLQSDDLMNTVRPNHAGTALGSVKYTNKNRIAIKLSDSLHQGDGIKFERTDTGFICNRIYKNGKLTNSGQCGETVELENKAEAKQGDTVVKTSDLQLIKQLGIIADKKIPVTAKLTAKKGEPLVLEFSDGINTAKAFEAIVEQSKTSPSKDLAGSISKLGDTPFELTDIEVLRDEDIFIAKSVLNSVRRTAAEELINKRTELKKRKVGTFVQRKPNKVQQAAPKIHVLLKNEEQLEAVSNLPVGDIYTTDIELYGRYPNMRLKTDRLAKAPVPLEGMRLLITDNGGLQQYHKDNDFVIDYTINTLNAYTLSVFADMGAHRFTLSPELQNEHIQNLISAYKTSFGYTPSLEALVYGRFELMAMQHCVISHSFGRDKNCGVCKKKPFYLEDIKGNRYPIVMDDNCNNYILHQRCEKKELKSLYDIGVRDFRIELLHEDAQESKSIVESYLKQLSTL